VDVGEAVEPAHRRQAPIDRRRSEAALFHVVAVQLDVRPGGGEDLEPTSGDVLIGGLVKQIAPD
jgi:hypothetical protein